LKIFVFTLLSDFGLPRIADTKPAEIGMPKGDYLWCSCGLSAKDPICDKAHKGTGLTPYFFEVTNDVENLKLCMCKHTKTPPFCDGSHKRFLNEKL